MQQKLTDTGGDRKSVTGRENRIGKTSETKETVSFEKSQRFSLAAVWYQSRKRQELETVRPGSSVEAQEAVWALSAGQR